MLPRYRTVPAEIVHGANTQASDRDSESQGWVSCTMNLAKIAHNEQSFAPHGLRQVDGLQLQVGGRAVHDLPKMTANTTVTVSITNPDKGDKLKTHNNMLETLQ